MNHAAPNASPSARKRYALAFGMPKACRRNGAPTATSTAPPRMPGRRRGRVCCNERQSSDLCRQLSARERTRRASGRLRRHEPRSRIRAQEADLAQLVERLPHADEADTAASRIHDDVRQFPAELLSEFEAHRLLSLDPVRLLQR